MLIPAPHAELTLTMPQMRKDSFAAAVSCIILCSQKLPNAGCRFNQLAIIPAAQIQPVESSVQLRALHITARPSMVSEDVQPPLLPPIRKD